MSELATKPDVPLKLYSPKEPLTATVIKNERLTHPDSANEVCHVEFSIKGSRYRYVEGQSVGVLPPGEDDNGRPHKLRLYSIASPAIGDDGHGETVSVCVKRLVYTDEQGIERRGVCSNFICDLKVGDEVRLTGPAGIDILMPDIPNPNIIMVATGTGIAPFRAFLHKRFAQKGYASGKVWMIFGAQTQKDFLYQQELESYQQYPEYELITAFSREQQNPDGSRMYVQHRIAERAEELVQLLQQPETYFYICGLRGMETGILEGLNLAAQKVGVSWDDLLAQLKAEHRWRIEVY